MLVAVLSICALILIAPDIDLEQSALRALRWAHIFFVLVTGLLAALTYLQVSVLGGSAAYPRLVHPKGLDILALRC